MRLVEDPKTSSSGSNSVNVPVVLFRYGEKRKLVRVSQDYDETIKFICRAFDIPSITHPAAISLQTSTLEVCKGIDTVIDESAYPYLWNFVEEMSVVIEAEAYRSESASEPIASSSSSHSSRKAEKAPADLEHHLPTPSVEGDDSDERERATRNPHGDTHTRFPDDLLDFTSDHAQEELDAMEQPREEEDEERPVEEKEEPVTARAEGSVHEDPPASRTSKKKFKKPSDDGASSSSRVVDDIFFPTKQEKDKNSVGTSDLSSRRGREPEREGGISPKKEKEAAQNLGPADDPRFEITIIGPDNTCAQFKTRGKHQVRKVLSVACKTFGLDVNRTQLVLRLEIDEDEDEYHDFVCPHGETISGCGVDSDSKLFLRDIPSGESLD